MEDAAELLSQAVQPRKREKGIVKWFDASRGYGFIQPREGEADIFVHFSAIQTQESYKTLSPDQPVEFELGSRDRKSTRLNSSHQIISYAVFCLKKKKMNTYHTYHKTSV